MAAASPTKAIVIANSSTKTALTRALIDALPPGKHMILYDDVGDKTAKTAKTANTAQRKLFEGRHISPVLYIPESQKVILLPRRAYCPDCAGTCVSGTTECGTCGGTGQDAAAHS